MADDIPFFKYHPDPLKTGAFETGEPVTCFCCGKKTRIFYTEPFFADEYGEEDEDHLCPECIKSGKASEKLEGEFQDERTCDPVSDAEKLEELCQRTPGYCGWQQEYWLAHCDDYCAYLGHVGWAEIAELGLEEEIEKDCLETGKIGIDIAEIKKHLHVAGGMRGYLFQCLHCKQHRLWVDFS